MQPVARATGKRFDTLGGRRLKTLRAGWICPDLGASRLNRSPATLFDDPLDLGPNPPRHNGSNLRLDALAPVNAYACPTKKASSSRGG